jgi:RNA polymerase sigma-70 factor (ECF subfamily)
MNRLVVRPRTDAELIAQSREEPAIFAELYDRHAAALQRFIARRLGSQIAEDVTAETFLVGFRRRGAYDPAHLDARPWLYGIAVRLIGRHRRAEVRMFRALARAMSPGPSPDETAAVDDRIASAAAGPAIARALSQLPADQRDVLLLAAWADLSYEEISAALGLPMGTVRSRLSRARARVRDSLAAAAYDSLETGGPK